MSIIRFLLALSLCFALASAQRVYIPPSLKPPTVKPPTPEYRLPGRPAGWKPDPKPPIVPNAEVKPEVVNTNMRRMNQLLVKEYAKAATDLASAILATTTKSAISSSTSRSAGSAVANQPHPTNINIASFEPCRAFANRLNTCAQSRSEGTFYNLTRMEQASCACYSNATESCIVTRIRDAEFDENSQKCQEMFENNGFDAISDLMAGEYWVGGTDFCALVNDLGNADIETDRPVSSATTKRTTYLLETMKATSTSGCVASKAAAFSPTLTPSSGAVSKGASKALNICALIALVFLGR